LIEYVPVIAPAYHRCLRQWLFESSSPVYFLSVEHVI